VGPVSTVGPPNFAHVSEIDSRHRILLCFHAIGQVAKCSDYRVSKSTDAGLKISPDHRDDLVAIASDQYPFPFGLNRFIRFLKLDHHGFEFTSVVRSERLLGKLFTNIGSHMDLSSGGLETSSFLVAGHKSGGHTAQIESAPTGSFVNLDEVFSAFLLRFG
jgi:hypothetical protein